MVATQKQQLKNIRACALKILRERRNEDLRKRRARVKHERELKYDAYCGSLFICDLRRFQTSRT